MKKISKSVLALRYLALMHQRNYKTQVPPEFYTSPATAQRVKMLCSKYSTIELENLITEALVAIAYPMGI